MFLDALEVMTRVSCNKKQLELGSRRVMLVKIINND